MVQHLIEACSRVNRLKEVILLGFYELNESLKEFVKTMSDEYHLNVKYLQEHVSLGTCGGIYYFKDQILENNPKAFFLINGDICGEFMLQDMLNFHESTSLKGETLMTIMVTEATRAQSLDYGCIVEEKKSHKILHYVEKPSTFVSSFINCGIYICSLYLFECISKVFDSTSQSKFNKNESSSLRYSMINEKLSEKFFEGLSLEKDILTCLAESENIYAYHTQKWWSQLKTASSAIYANRHYLRLYKETHPELLAVNSFQKPTIIGDVSIDPSAIIDPSSTVSNQLLVIKFFVFKFT